MTFCVRRDQILAIHRSRYAEQVNALFPDTGVRASVDTDSRNLLLTDPAGRVTHVAMSTNGLRLLATTPAGRKFRVELNDAGKLQGVTNPAGYRIGISYDEAQRPAGLEAAGIETWRLGYSEGGKVESIRFPDGTERRFQYDRAQQTLRTTNRLGHTQSLSTSNGTVSSIADANGHETHFGYGAWNRPDRAALPDGSEETYRYDANGAVAAIRWANSDAVEIENNERGEPLTMAYSDGQRLRFAYDDAGHIIKAASDSGAFRFGWEKGRLIEEASESAVVRYAYHEDGRLAAQTYPGGGRVEFSYDPDGRITLVRDWKGGLHTFEHTPTDDRTIQRSPSGLKTLVTFSAAGQPTNTFVRGGRGQPMFSTSFTYDGERRMTSDQDSEHGSRVYRYDAEGQLLGVITSDGKQSESFAYDGAGNRIHSDGHIASFGSVNELLQQGSVGLRYDGRGNATIWPGTGGSWRLRWDERGLLVAAAGPAGEHVRFLYDVFGRRIRKQLEDANGKVIRQSRYVWAGEHLIAQYTESHSEVRSQEFLYLPGTFTPLTTRIDGRVYSYHCDPRGAPTRMTDDNGRVVWAATYRAFGEAVVHLNEVDNPLRLPGQWLDEETGLHYNRFRYYAPKLGRYLSRDPLGIAGGFNLYTYSGNDPVNRSDPLGLWPSWEATLAAVVGGAVAVAVVAAGVATAPLSLPLLAGAAVMGLAFGIGTHKLATRKDLDPVETAKAFGLGLLEGAVFGGLVIGGGYLLMALAMPIAAATLIVGVAAVGTLTMCTEHAFYDEMTPLQQSRSVGGFWGNLIGAIAVGAGAAKASRMVGELGDAIGKGVDEGIQSFAKEMSQPGAKPPPPPEVEPLTPEQAAALEAWYRERYTAKSYPGHGNARHGPDTSIVEQAQRVQTGEAPDGNLAPTSKATKFDSYAKEVEAVEKARAKNPGAGKPKYRTDSNGKTVYDNQGKPIPSRDAIVVDDGPEGYGSGVEVQRGADGKPLPGRPIQPTGQQPNAVVVFEYNPKTDAWEPFTQYPTDDPPTP